METKEANKMKQEDVRSKILWGAATAAYQVEGAAFCDGKGKNSWDEYYELNDLGYDGSRAVDHYHHVAEDLKLFKEIGLKSYRFSVSWSRILPEGTGEINQKGLDFYDFIVDTLNQYGIEPYLTLYHWDLPLPLLKKGGWLNPEVIEDYLEYCRILFSHFKGRVRLWATINEPASEVIEGYIQGTHPPQEKNYGHAIQVSHHYNLASARAIKLFREMDMEGKIGIVLNPMPVDVLEETPENLEARKIAYDFLSDWYIRPALTGHYPPEMLEYCQKTYHAPVIKDTDYQLMEEYTGDYLGINYYMRRVVKAGKLDSENIEDRFSYVRVPDGEYTKWGWEIYPSGVENLLRQIYNDYGKQEIIIAENGIGFDDQMNEAGEFQDDERISYLSRHLSVIEGLSRQGIDIAAYYVWSAIDLLSWTNGYQKRYGLVGVDFETLKRSIKKSGYWYRDFIKGEISLSDMCSE